MGDSREVLELKEKFFFSSYNRTALNPALHVHDEKLKCTPAPSTKVVSPSAILSDCPAFYAGFTQAGGEFFAIFGTLF